MRVFRRAEAARILSLVLYRTLPIVVAVLGSMAAAQAQQSPQPQPEACIVVIGEGSVSVAPDYAELRAGATTRAKTAREAAAANNQVMTAITATLTGAGIEQKDFQTARYTVQPVYAAPQPNIPPRLALSAGRKCGRNDPCGYSGCPAAPSRGSALIPR